MVILKVKRPFRDFLIPHISPSYISKLPPPPTSHPPPHPSTHRPPPPHTDLPHPKPTPPPPPPTPTPPPPPTTNPHFSLKIDFCFTLYFAFFFFCHISENGRCRHIFVPGLFESFPVFCRLCFLIQNFRLTVLTFRATFTPLTFCVLRDLMLSLSFKQLNSNLGILILSVN